MGFLNISSAFNRPVYMNVGPFHIISKFSISLLCSSVTEPLIANKYGTHMPFYIIIV